MSYTQEQMKEIYRGIRCGVDVAQYRNSELKPEQMKQLRLGLQQGVDISKYNMPYIDAERMKELRKALTSGIKTNVFDIREGANYTAAQVKQIRLGLENEQDVELWANPAFTAAEMREIRIGQRDGIDAALYASTDFSVEQMKKLRIEMTIQLIIEKIKETCAALWAKLTAWAEQTTPTDIVAQNEAVADGLTIEQARQAALQEKISQAFAEVFGSVEKLSQTVSEVIEKEDKVEDNEFDEMSIDEKLDAFKAEIDRQMSENNMTTAQQNEATEEMEM